MGKNTKIVTLLISVIAIWGIISYKIMVELNPPNITNYSEITKPELIVNEFQGRLSLDYADPFLKTRKKFEVQVIRSSSVSKKNKKLPNATIQAKQLVNWEKLTFLGALKKSNHSELYAVLSIDGVEFIIKEENIVEGFLVKKIYKDSVLISFQDQNKILKKK